MASKDIVLCLVLLLSVFSYQSHAKTMRKLVATAASPGPADLPPPDAAATSGGVNTGIELIKKSCEKTMYKDLCEKSLGSWPEAETGDLQGLLKFALKTAQLTGVDVYNKLQVTFNKTSDKVLQQGLTDCSDNYQDAIDQFEDSMAAVDSQSYADVNIWISAAMTDVESCEDGLKEQSGSEPELIQWNTKFNQLCSISLSLTNELAN